MTQLRLRPANQEDAAFAYAVEENAMRAYAEETWGRWTPASDRDGFVASFVPATHSILELEGHRVGVVSVEHHPDHVQLAKLYILAEHRNAGVGSQVLTSIRFEAKKLRQPLKLRVLAVNRRALAFYERHGFIVESRTTERVYMSTPAA